MGTKEHGKKAFGFENTVPMVLGFCRYRIWVSSRWNFALLPLACSGMFVCLFLPPGFSDAYAGGLVCFLRLFPVCSGLIRHFSEFFFIFFRVCFGGVKSMFYSILLGGFGGNSYLCKDFPLKKFLENIWWERKKYLPLQPQTRNKRPSRWGKRFSRERMKKEFFERFT